MRTIYVVIGTCGEYSDRNEWLVAAYVSEGAAAQRVVDCERESKIMDAVAKEHTRYGDEFEEAKKLNVADPNYRSDYTGTKYTLAPIELVDA